MLNKKLTQRCFSGYIQTIKGSLGFGDDTKSMESLAFKDPAKFASPFSTKAIEQKEVQVSTVRLSNGITVIAESPRIPSTVTMGVLLDLGSRDEDSKTSGALHSIKTTYYKSFLKTNETINYGMMQMSGGSYSMDFSREHAIFKASCLSHDVVDIFTMMTDCTFEPRNFVSSNVGIAKLPHSHTVAKLTNRHHELTDKIFQAVYGNHGLGNPILGHEKNIINLDAYTMQQFQLNNIATDRIVVGALNVEHPEEFFELVELKLGGLKYNQTARERETAMFKESDVRNLKKGSPNSQIAIVFEAPSWKSENLLHYYLISELLGKVEVGHHESLNAQKSKFYDNIYSKNAFIDSLEAVNMHFTDSGLFIMRSDVNGDHVNKTIEMIANEVKSLSNISNADLNIAKKKLKLKIIGALENDNTRIEELLKQQSVYGKTDLQTISQRIDSIDAGALQKTLQNLAKSKMSFIVETENLQNVHSHDKIKALFA